MCYFYARVKGVKGFIDRRCFCCFSERDDDLVGCVGGGSGGGSGVGSRAELVVGCGELGSGRKVNLLFASLSLSLTISLGDTHTRHRFD